MPVLVVEDVRLDIKPGAYSILKKIEQLLAAEDIPAFIVGGFVRDSLLDRDTGDIDIAVGADALETARKIAAALEGKYVPLDTENGVGRVIIPGEAVHLDFTTLNGGIGEDLARRDFTVDAIALPLDDQFGGSIETGRLIDPFHGQEDLRRRILRAISDRIFKADAVRLLRAIRISAELGLRIDDETESLIRRDSRLITTVAGERVREELLRLLAVPGAGPRLAYMDDLGFLTTLIPEMEPARGVDQPLMHVWDVLNHSIQTVAAVEFLLRQRAWDYAGADVLAAVPWSDKLSGHFKTEIGSGSPRAVLLKLAALLHDVAKPETKTTDPDGRTRFLGHPLEGAATAASIMERLRFSNREIQHVELLIKYHLRPTQMSQEGEPTRRAVYRYFRDTGETGIDLLFLSLADHLAARGATLDREQWREHTALTGFVLDRHFEAASQPKPFKLIDGNDLMETFRLAPGPKIGDLLEALREAQAAGEVTDKPQALAFARRLLSDSDTSETNRLKEK